eukprot:1194846-Prorocentrum_minimum.AAC.11
MFGKIPESPLTCESGPGEACQNKNKNSHGVASRRPIPRGAGKQKASPLPDRRRPRHRQLDCPLNSRILSARAIRYPVATCSCNGLRALLGVWLYRGHQYQRALPGHQATTYYHLPGRSATHSLLAPVTV